MKNLFSRCWAGGFVGALLVLSCAVKAENPTHPSLKVTTLDGDIFDLANHRGSWVVVNFWATWCTPCLKEMPALSTFDAERADVAVIGLAYEDIAAEEMKAFLGRYPVSYPVAIIGTGEPLPDFPTPRGLPMTYLIAPDGKAAKRFIGPITAPDLAQSINSYSSSTKETLNKSILDVSECAEPGPGRIADPVPGIGPSGQLRCPDSLPANQSATPNQALAYLIRGAPFLARGRSELVQTFPK